MDTILQDLPQVICYIDNILITGANNSDHLNNLAGVLQRLQDHGFRNKLDKCKFMQQSMEYLGHKIDSKWLHPISSRVKAIAKAPKPRNLQEMRSFHGLLNYYGKFIPNLSILIQALNSLLQKGHWWKWTQHCSKAV